ncbi:MAG: helix-turn-helix domain-containing protein [Deltaproteobacteria bacterium]|nr:helix-turn-helix domain-containing protein [Deltaproteobacteria bacterium]
MQQINEKRWLGIKDAASYLSVSYRSLYNRTCDSSENPLPKEIAPKRFGKKLLFDRKAIDEYLEGL